MNKKFYLIFLNAFLVLVCMFNFSSSSYGQMVKIKAIPDSVLCVGQTLKLERTYTDTTQFYTVYYKGTTPLDTADSYTKMNIQVIDSGKYVVVIFKSSNNSILSSSSVNITVDTIPYYKNIDKVDPKTCKGKEGSFTLTKLKGKVEYNLSYIFNGQTVSANIKTDSLGNLKLGNLGAGKYTEIKVKVNPNKCTSDVSLDSVILKDPTPDTTTLILDQEMCFGQTIEIDEDPLGGDLSIVFGPGILTGNPKKLTTNGPGDQIIVQYIYKDSKNCIDTAQSIVKVNSLPLIDPITIKDVSCHGFEDGNITIANQENNTYKWSKVDESGSVADGLKSGSYSVTVTSDKGCIVVRNNINITEPEVLDETNLKLDLTICNNLADTIPTTITGGTEPYIIKWTNPILTPSSEKNIIFNMQGQYLVTITDANQCEIIREITVTKNKAIPLKIISSDGNKITDHFCQGDSIKLNASGADSYKWYDNSPNSNVNISSAGKFNVTGYLTENGRECKETTEIEIFKDKLPEIKFENNNKQEPSNIFQICRGEPLDIIVSENSSGYKFLWFDGSQSTEGQRIFFSEGIYPLNVTNDTTGCVNSDSFQLKFKNFKDISIVTANIDIPYEREQIFCRNENLISFYINGNVGPGNDFLENHWNLINGNTDSTNSGKIFSINLINHYNDFLIIGTARDKQNCPSTDTIIFKIQEPENNIFSENSCGILLLKDNYFLDGIQPSNVKEFKHGFYYITGSVKLNYKFVDPFGKPCFFTMKDPFVNEISNAEIVTDNLIFDECGPFLLAKYKAGFCYTWYEINKADKSRQIVVGRDSSWFSNPDTLRYDYVAIANNCSFNCDTSFISTRSSEGGETIPCYNSGESSIMIYPNPNQGHMYLKLEGLPAGKQDIYIYDMMGRMVYKKTIDHTGNNDVKELSLSHLTDGIYFAKTDRNGNNLSTKFIITH